MVSGVISFILSVSTITRYIAYAVEKSSVIKLRTSDSGSESDNCFRPQLAYLLKISNVFELSTNDEFVLWKTVR